MRRVILSVLALLCLGSCKKDPPAPKPAPAAGPVSSQPWTVPGNLGHRIPAPRRNPMTDAGVALGRRLFHDPILSSNNAVSCTTCHKKKHAFSDNTAFSKGVSGKPTLRNTPPLINLAWARAFFWDGGGVNLESQAFAPIKHADEMAQDLNGLLRELKADKAYPQLFAQAFPKDGITLPNLVRALAQFQRTLVSGNSRYDKFVRGEPGGDLSPLEKDGLRIVRQKCGVCHSGEHFTDHAYHNTGLKVVYSDEHERLNWGRARIDEQYPHKGAYKTPTLRNLGVTAPYMHDGRHATLSQVIEHYRSGIEVLPTLDPLLMGPTGEAGIDISASDEAAILAFLSALMDPAFVAE
jgi:cytochrome c peroxidase